MQLIGYNTSTALFGCFVPQKIQNLVIREYAKHCDLNLAFSRSEYKDMRGIMLKSIVDEYQDFGICFYSIDQCFEWFGADQFVIELIHQQRWLGFALEGLNTFANRDEIIELITLRTMIGKSLSLDQFMIQSREGMQHHQ